MSFRDWLYRFWQGQKHKREIEKPRQINDEERFSELATLIERGDVSEVSLDRMADLMGQIDPNRSRFEA